MAIVQSVDFYAFRQAFEDFDRKDQFSPVALRALFDYLEDLSEDTGEPIELDVIGLCCEWSEMTWQEAAIAYDIDLSHCDDDDERAGDVGEYLHDHTLCVDLDNGSFLFVNF